MTAVRTLLGFMGPYRWAAPVLVVLGILGSLSEGLGIGLLIPLLQVLLGGGATTEGAGPVVDAVQRYAALFPEATRLPVIVATIVGLIAFKVAVFYASAALFAWVNGHVGHRLRRGLFHQLLHVGYVFLARNDPGRLLNTLGTETWRATDALSALFSLITHACMVGVFVVLLLLVSWPLTLGVAGGLALASLVVRLVTWQTRRLGEVAVVANGALADRMVDGLTGMRVIRAFGQEAREQARFDRASDRVRGTFLTMELTSGLVQPLLELLFVPLLLAALLLAWRAGLALPTVFAFALMLYRLQPHMRGLDQARVYLDSLLGAVTAVTSLLDDRDKPYTRSGTRPFEGLRTGIVFRGVRFDYDTGGRRRSALDGVSFEIRKGRVTAIVGDSGAGKSTLVNLLCRFYDPDDGEILVDGRPLHDLDLAAWRGRIGLAGQDADLVSGTIAENIAYGRPGASHEAITAAARLADAHGFIESLPDGYRTRVGDRGLSLSGGQRQRIGLARALLRDPDLLILDEATNALDGPSQRAIQEALERLPPGRTIAVIAHRLSTIRHADHVVVLSEGRVVEQGRPSDLAAGTGAFARLYAHEAAAFRAAGD